MHTSLALCFITVGPIMDGLKTNDQNQSLYILYPLILPLID